MQPPLHVAPVFYVSLWRSCVDRFHQRWTALIVSKVVPIASWGRRLKAPIFRSNQVLWTTH